MTLPYTDAQVVEVVDQIRRNTPPSARCPVCQTTLLMEPVIWQQIDRNGDDPEVRGVRFNDYKDVLRVGFNCPKCARGVGHVSMERGGADGVSNQISDAWG